jgi:hypothetical protein
MIEIEYVSLVAGVAITLSTYCVDIGEAIGKAVQTAERIKRMEAEPSPEYEHYPNPVPEDSASMVGSYFEWDGVRKESSGSH